MEDSSVDRCRRRKTRYWSNEEEEGEDEAATPPAPHCSVLLDLSHVLCFCDCFSLLPNVREKEREW